MRALRHIGEVTYGHMQGIMSDLRKKTQIWFPHLTLNHLKKSNCPLDTTIQPFFFLLEDGLEMDLFYAMHLTNAFEVILCTSDGKTLAEV